MPEVRTFGIGDGLALEYVDGSDPEGTPMVLLHGNTDSRRAWEPMFPHLPASIRAFAISQRGHGNSSKPTDGYTLRDFASDVEKFLDAVGVARAVVVGHSSHGLVAQRFAIDHPDRTLGIVPISAPATVRDKAGLRALVTELSTVTDPLDPDYVRGFVSGTFAVPLADAFLDMIVSESLKVPARVWRAIFEGLLAEDVSTERASITVPTLLLWGDRDEIVGRAEQDAVLDQIARAELVVYEGVGHSPHWESPERVAADLANFVRAL